jgi:hypothetical protein
VGKLHGIPCSLPYLVRLAGSFLFTKIKDNCDLWGGFLRRRKHYLLGYHVTGTVIISQLTEV